jgi:hypothetical protein
MQQAEIYFFFIFFKVMFGKNPFSPKTKTIKMGLTSVCQTRSLSKENF